MIKKTISIFLAVLMLFCTTVPTFAVDISGDEYAKEAKAVFEKGQPLAAAVVFERAAEAYKEAEDTNSEQKAYSSAGEAYEQAEKTALAIEAYLAANDFDKAKSLFLAGDLSGMSGDDYLDAAEKMAAHGVPKSELGDIYEKALAAYQSGTLSGNEWIAAANRLESAGFAADKLTGIYEKAARTLLAEAKAQEDKSKALLFLQKANSLAGKHGNTELSSEIQSILESMLENFEAYQNASVILEAARENSEDYDQFASEFYQILLELFPNLMSSDFSQEDRIRVADTLVLAGDLCANEGLYFHAYILYPNAITYCSYNESGNCFVLNDETKQVLDKISNLLENTPAQVIDTYGATAGMGMASTVLSFCITVLSDYDLALEWAEKFDAAQIPSYEYGMTWQNFVNMAKAQVESENLETGSTISEGSLVIVVGIAAAAAGFLAAMFLFRKKNPEPAGEE